MDEGNARRPIELVLGMNASLTRHAVNQYDYFYVTIQQETVTQSE